MGERLAKIPLAERLAPTARSVGRYMIEGFAAGWSMPEQRQLIEEEIFISKVTGLPGREEFPGQLIIPMFVSPEFDKKVSVLH